MKKLFLASLTLTMMALPVVSAENERLTLGGALSLAYANNCELRAAEKAGESAACGVKSSYGAFLPKISVEGSITRLDDELALDVSDVRTAMIAADVATLQAAGQTNPAVLAAFKARLASSLPPFISQIQDDNYSHLAALVVQPVFMGGKLVLNSHLKREESRIARLESARIKNKVICDVCTAYFRVLLCRDVAAIRAEVRDGMRSHARDAQQLFAQGVIAKAATLKTDVALSEAERELSKAERDRALALLTLNNAVGVPVAGRELATPFSLAVTSTPVEAYAQAARENNPRKNIVLHRKTMLGLKKNTVRSNFLPSVYAFGRYELYKEDLTALEPAWAAGLAAKINLFNGGSDVMDARAARKEIESIDEYLKYVDEGTTLRVRMLYNEMESAREQYLSLNASRDLAEENLRLTRASFKEGMASATDVIDAELTLGKVKAEQSKSLYDCVTSLVNMLGDTGRAETIIEYVGREVK